ncbi:glycosyltransferase family 2 protein [Herbiconiux sp. SYSU D00978]|uniref:glycosyltransferase family 2 protein n=1 Tax=Herbiconiux sp. SYSU D00978 TaxID=2812562 RepID=UPI001A9761FE|nr:glycosyltransferase family 2 protein [Herbiconiux sp. SYSU D00978]
MRSRRGSEAWGRPPQPPQPRVEVLIPTAGRSAELAVTLSGLAAQDDPAFDVIVSDQSTDASGWHSPSVQAMVRVLEAQNRRVTYLRHEVRRGLAEHRQFLLDHASADAVLFLDDDVWLEPGTISRMLDALDRLECGFVGSAVQGLSYLDDDRPHEREEFEPAEEARPEIIRRGLPGFDRWKLHNAANLAHVAAQLDLDADEWRAYRVAWVGACVLYRRRILVEAGGFRFWNDIPAGAVGEDVAAQWRVMETAGGVGIVPSGAVHLEAPTTIPDRPVDAFDLLFSSEDGTPAAEGVAPGGDRGAVLRDR